MLNRTRLAEPIALAEFAARTGLGVDALAPGLGRALETGLLERHEFAGDVTATFAHDRIGNVTPTCAIDRSGDVTPTCATDRSGDVATIWTGTS